MLALWLGAQSGTLFMYQGQEIGMVNAPKEWSMDDYISVDGRKYWSDAMGLDDEKRRELTKYRLQIMARDYARLPMQWNGSGNAGFTEEEPWMRVHGAFEDINEEKQERDEESVLAF